MLGPIVRDGQNAAVDAVGLGMHILAVCMYAR